MPQANHDGWKEQIRQKTRQSARDANRLVHAQLYELDVGANTSSSSYVNVSTVLFLILSSRFEYL